MATICPAPENLARPTSKRPTPSRKTSPGTRRYLHKIRQAIFATNAADSNRRITVTHAILGAKLREMLGGEAGPNFHDWAVWGSHKAGATIREEDHRTVSRFLFRAHVIVTLAAIAGSFVMVSPTAACGALVVSLFIAVAVRRMIQAGASNASRQILAGNRTVLADIGEQTAHFLQVLHYDDPYQRQIAFGRFMANLNRKRQPLLSEAFREYFRAFEAFSVRRKREHILAANCLAVAHEHIRLQPYIQASMPTLLRRLITRTSMRYQVGGLSMDVSKTQQCETRTSHAFASIVRKVATAVGVNADKCDASVIPAAKNWACFDSRVPHILALFHNLHGDANAIPNMQFISDAEYEIR